MKFEIRNPKYEIWSINYEGWNVKSEICNRKYEIKTMKYEIRNMKAEYGLQNRTLKPVTGQLKLETTFWNTSSEFRIMKPEVWNQKSSKSEIWNLEIEIPTNGIQNS